MEQVSVFISYRRKNKDFVRRLVAALEAQGSAIWIDWEDIPPGSVDFTRDIQQGVDGNDAFIAVLSPDYLESDYCLAELAYAVQSGKRIIPVVYVLVDDRRVPESIAHINWVYFCPHSGEANPFDEALPRLLTALNTDQDHVRQHTRLLVRAREWEARRRDTSFLLTGIEVSEAETWLAWGVGKQPQPTTLHAEYIMASQEAEEAHRRYEQRLQRQSRDRLRLLIGLLVSVALLGVASLVWFYASASSTVSTLAEDKLATTLEIAAAGIDGDAFAALVRDGVPRADGYTNDTRFWQQVRWLQKIFGGNPSLRSYTYAAGSQPGQILFVADGGALDGVGARFLEPAALSSWDAAKFAEGLVRTVIYPDRYQDALGSWLSGYTPIRDSGGMAVGALGLDMRMEEFLALPNRVLNVARIIVVLLVGAGLIGAAIYGAFRRRQQQAMRSR